VTAEVLVNRKDMGAEMSKNLIRGAVRKTVDMLRRFKAWADEPEDGAADDAHRQPDQDLSYVWLNSELEKMIVQGGTINYRPNYAWGVLQSAHVAKALGMKRISVIEFGVAGGNGLVSLEKIADRVEGIFSIDIDVYGFDTGKGLPKPQDHRDLPSLWIEGGFAMDVDRLKSRLAKAQLMLGAVETTVPDFISSRPAPVAFISFDLDYYSSTMHAFGVLQADQKLLLPRVYCYFDDIMGHIYSDYTGERLAIREFNAAHPMRKVSPVYGLKHFLPKPYADETWAEMFYLCHIFDHPLYSANDGLVKPSRYRDATKLMDDFAAIGR